MGCRHVKCGAVNVVELRRCPKKADVVVSCDVHQFLVTVVFGHPLFTVTHQPTTHHVQTCCAFDLHRHTYH